MANENPLKVLDEAYFAITHQNCNTVAECDLHTYQAKPELSRRLHTRINPLPIGAPSHLRPRWGGGGR